MMKLYAMPGTCALAPNIASVWANLPVELVNLERGEHQSDAYLKVNPKGQVPALLFDDGQVLTEALAILLYIASLSEVPELIPRGPMEWARQAEALSYMSSEVHSDFGPHFVPERFASFPEAKEDVQQHTYRKLEAHFRRLDTSFKEAGGDGLLGRRTVVDAYLFVLCRWMDSTPLDLSSFPSLAEFRSRLESEEAVIRALKRQKMTV
ncbi:glutathione S-transferase N-terminal domain-containing protein [Microbulbifer sp. CnH-101-G]|uniref:glutathione S-transferase N-terminal domain-containing protein n=1 Tax=Microbulbifer sp. CnH-101-G TaxID=3243393 RepID=UPI00403A1B30